MTPSDKRFACIYLAWGILLLVTGLIQKDRKAQSACLLGAAGFAVLGANLFTVGVLHLAMRAAGLGLLLWAGVLSFQIRSQPAR